MQGEFPILEYDPDRQAIIEPRRPDDIEPVPESCVICFFQDAIARLRDQDRLRVITHLTSEIGLHPVYEMLCENQKLVLFHPGVGAPLTAGLLEEVIALGCRKFMVCGGAGVLDRQIAGGHLVVPTSAVRDEGTSYHYLAPSREVAAPSRAVCAIENTLKEAGVAYVLGKTWTTDAIFRETRTKIAQRKSEGCITVEMEAAAFFAVARFRGVELGQILYGGDDVSGIVWDGREAFDRTTIREQLVWLAAKACLSI